MRFYHNIGLALLCLLLVACAHKNSPEPTEKASSSSSSQVSTASSETTRSEAGAVTFNGSYYAVAGKYGEVVIVNKKHGLSPDYAPGEDPTALAAFQELLAEMKAQGFAVSDAYSGFRSYDTQAGLYQNYVATDGQEAADRYSARPGYSEHQTGLGFDVIDATTNDLLEEPVASQWLRDHAHEYGFIVRYLPGKEEVTGYMAEPWHLRYIGQEASDIAQSGLTLEEYFKVPGGDYAN